MGSVAQEGVGGTGRKPRGRWVLFALVPLGLMLLLLEGAVRLWTLPVGGDVSRFNIPQPECHRPSLTLGYEHLPGACGFNQYGFLDKGFPLQKGPGVFRIVLLGDSIATHEGWISLLTDELGRQLRRPVEVWNGGVSGYDTCQEATLLREIGWAVKPDLVLVQVCPNDLAGSAVLFRSRPGWFRAYLNQQAVDVPSFLLRSRLATWLALRGWQAHGPTPLNRPELVRSCLEEIRDEARARQIPLVAVHFPVLWSVPVPPPPLSQTHIDYQSEQTLKVMHQQAGIRFLSLREPLEALQPLENYRRTPDDLLHPDMLAQRVAGESLAGFLLADAQGKP